MVPSIALIMIDLLTVDYLKHKMTSGYRFNLNGYIRTCKVNEFRTILHLLASFISVQYDFRLVLQKIDL